MIRNTILNLNFLFFAVKKLFRIDFKINLELKVFVFKMFKIKLINEILDSSDSKSSSNESSEEVDYEELVCSLANTERARVYPKLVLGTCSFLQRKRVSHAIQN